MTLAEELTEKLAYKISFYIPLGDFRIPVPQSVVATWIVIGFLVVVSIILTRNLQVVPKGKQALLEVALEKIYNMLYGILGERGKRYIPCLMTLFIFLVVANMSGLVGLPPPTKDLNTTAGLAIMSIVLVQYAGIRQWGFAGWLKRFAHPMALIAPMNIMEIVIKPVSLCMRLFGNILGGYIVMELVMFSIPVILPLAVSLYFDIFDGILQAYIFCFLTALYIQEAVED